MARKQRTGVVVSDAMSKTVVVRVERTVTHPLYRKVLRRRKQYQAHDETELARLGDRVLIEECRPISRRKKYRVVEILERHEVAEIQPTEIAAPDLEPEPAETPATASEAPAAAASEAPAGAGTEDAPAEDGLTEDAEAEGAAEAETDGGEGPEEQA